METTSLIIIIAVYFIASFYGSMTGGAALLTIPVLIFTGIAPHTAIGTHKIGSIGLGIGGAAGYKKEQKVKSRILNVLVAFAVIGSVVGSLIVLSISENTVKKIIGVIMLFLAGLTVLDRKAGTKPMGMKLKESFLAAYSFISGVYYGFYTAGIGIINRFVLSNFFSLSVLNSSAISTIFSLTTGIASFFIFAYFGNIDYSLFFPVLVVSALGGYLGAKYSIKLGNEKVKMVLIATSLIMAVKLLFF